MRRTQINRMPFASDMPPTEMIDDRMVGRMRLLLAAGATLIVSIDPSAPDHYFGITQTTLLLYVLYSAAVLAFGLRGVLLLPAKFAHWVDLGWCVALMAPSRGSSGIFFGFFFFVILSASFRIGYEAGLRAVMASMGLFLIVGFSTSPKASNVALAEYLLRSISLGFIGYMIAFWGGSEFLSKRRLALLKDITALSNPRFGIDHTVGLIVERLRTFYNADACLHVSADPYGTGYTLRRASSQVLEKRTQGEPIGEGLAHQLLALPAEHAVVYFGKPPAWEWWWSGRRDYTYDCAKQTRTEDDSEESERLGAMLDAASFVTVPLYVRGQTVGRLFLTSRRAGAFQEPDVAFLLQVIDHTMPVVDNIRLVDRLASEAANEERRRIARDIHDSVIQPYIGIQIGLSAVRQKLASGNPDFLKSIDRLLEMTEVGINDLRRYVLRLKASERLEDSLLAAVQRFAGKFSEATGIAVKVESDGDTRINDRLAAEVFQMVAEGLSNVRRHTSAVQITISLACRDGHLSLRIVNDGAAHASAAAFTPRSIAERARALGGQVRVDRQGHEGTAVVIDVPL